VARTFNGTTQYATRASSYLAAASGGFTVALWFTPANLSDSVKAVLANGTSGATYWQLRLDAGVVVFESAGYTGTNPGTGSGITWSTATGKFVAWRYRGQANEWSKWDAGTKSVISASISFTLPTPGTQFDIARNWSGAYCAGTYAEVGLWSVALTDEQMAELAAGVAADVVCRTGLVGYWPLRGNNSPEYNYAVEAEPLALTAAPTQATHPTIVPPKHATLVEPTWLVDLQHTAGTVYASTFDVSSHIDVDVLGRPYAGLLTDDIRIIEAMPDSGAGVMVPSNTTVQLNNASGTVSPSAEWRQVPMRIRYYDRASHALMTEFSGLITDRNISRNRAVFACRSDDAAVLSQLVPRQVVTIAGTAGIIDQEDANTVRPDLGAPIPVVFGRGFLSPPYIGQATNTLDGGSDFLCGYGTSTRIEKVWWDWDTNTPGLELGVEWDTNLATSHGPFTSMTTTTFGMPTAGTLNAQYTFNVGRPLRYIGAAGTAFSHVSSYSGTVVTIADSILPVAGSAFGTIQTGSEFTVDDTRYTFNYVGGSVFLKTIRFRETINAAPLVQVYNSFVTNPAVCMQFILEDQQLGLGQTCDATSWTAAQAAFTAAGLSTAVNGVLGGDRTQRRAQDVLDEIAWFRGARIWKDADAGAWKILVDTQPSASVATLEFGPNTKGNIADVQSITRTPLDSAVSTMKLRYKPLGRERASRSLEQVDYAFTAQATVLSIGAERVVASPWIGVHADAARVLYYNAKQLARSDERVQFTVRHEGRRITLGDVVTLTIDLDGDQIAGDYRITARERTLTEFTFVAVGPYNADTYSTDSGTINAFVSQPSGEVNPDERSTQGASDANLLANPDWSTKTRTSSYGVNPDATIIPGWAINSTNLNGVPTITQSPLAKGGYYCQMVTAASLAGGTPSFYATADGTVGVLGAITVQPETPYMASIYASQHGAKWRLEFFFRDASNLAVTSGVVPLRVNPGDVNGLGDQRWYGIARSPSNAASLFVSWIMTSTSTTYRWDAAQLEELTRVSLRPTPWHRNIAYGITPAQITEGNATFRPAEFSKTTEHGTTFGHTTRGTVGIAMSGGTVTLGTAQAGIVTCVTARVLSGLTFAGGGASWRIGTSANPTMFATGLGTAAAVTVADAEMRVGPVRFGTATAIIATPNTGTFSAGTVVATIHHQSHTAPTG
jgi:hypothetical protein